ncbi:uncharacterized protein BJ212DRAFT_1300891 [Suillus subaureus]|uniref:Uncharacterized protein n=1 Tax=Suillus subaureus TaxID=48587 RepID=A0A9P7E8A7_9AGAM|nr:uncharacterized protein BJ212DRAFT_1300891 [Suillus subaureus]KAG1814035.1 hypothetical protein BJ212DRAFT_1300891 [Suillus subaureus]
MTSPAALHYFCGPVMTDAVPSLVFLGAWPRHLTPRLGQLHRSQQHHKDTALVCLRDPALMPSTSELTRTVQFCAVLKAGTLLPCSVMNTNDQTGVLIVNGTIQINWRLYARLTDHIASPRITIQPRQKTTSQSAKYLPHYSELDPSLQTSDTGAVDIDFSLANSSAPHFATAKCWTREFLNSYGARVRDTPKLWLLDGLELVFEPVEQAD